MHKGTKMSSEITMKPNFCSMFAVLFGLSLLLGFCFYTKHYSSEDSNDTLMDKDQPFDYVDKLAYEGLYCMREFRNDYRVFTNETFAQVCYTNPFFIWSGIVGASVIASVLCLF